MKHKIFLGTRLTTLELYVSVLTQFEASTGNLQCRDVVLLAENPRMASVLLAQEYPEWDVQTLTCLTDMPWFDIIMMDENCPQITTLRQFVVSDIEAVPVENDPPRPNEAGYAGNFRKRRPHLN